MPEYVDVKKAISAARECFVMDRSKLEHTFNEWYQGLLNCGKQEILDKLTFDYQNMSLRSECPALYEDFPVKEDCNSQITALNAKMVSVNLIVDELNRENLQKLEEYAVTKGIRI